MFESTVIVQSAVSAFNNAALVAPAFLWWAILALPLFFMTWFCAPALLGRLGWNANNVSGRVSLWVVLLTLAWVVMFGGNYGVLRDNATVLPFMIAAIVFVASVFVGSNLRNLNLPAWRGAPRRQKFGIAAVWVVILAAIGLSDMHAWWGPLLQIGAFLVGILIGRASRVEMRPVAGTTLVVLATTVAILMQPEFFRFGQLGALTPVHLVGLILVAMTAAATVALRNIRPRGFIRHSAYVKLKWLGRFLSVLCMALFILTESVPIFLGMTLMFGLLFAMSVWHAEKLPERIDEKIFAVTIGLLGIITTMPAVTALGILYWVALPRGGGARQFGFLL